MNDKNQIALTPEEKRRRRFEAWLNPEHIRFTSREIENNYKIRASRFINAFNIAEPDQIPVLFRTGNLPLQEFGINYQTASYNFTKLVEAYDQFNQKHSSEFDMFFCPDPLYIVPARTLDILGYKLFSYPGHGLPENNPGFQYNEAEYMKAEDYDDLIRDPSDFWLRIYLPRIFTALEPLRGLSSLTGIIEIPTLNLLSLTNPGVRASLQALVAAGEALEAIRPVLDYRNKSIASGFPLTPSNGLSLAPFDVIADTLRGTRGAMSDIYRQPQKLLEALDVVADLLVAEAKNMARNINNLAVFVPLHKGADGWMSQKQFETFYWPQLKKVINAYIEEGVVVRLFAEGKYDSRLDSVNEFPKSAVSWWFDQTDMARAKKILGNRCCIQGNVPSSMLVTASPQQVKDYCRNLVEVCGSGGGFILSPGANPDYPKLENLHAMVEAVKP